MIFTESHKRGNLYSLFLIVVLLCSFQLVLAAPTLSVAGLKIDHMIKPMGIDRACPHFSWKLFSALRNTKQTQYRIRISYISATGKRKSWIQSGTGEQSVWVAYQGQPLAAATRYYWQVQVWDNHGNISPWSATSYFQTGLDEQDFKAEWISPVAGDTSVACLEFREEFLASRELRSATIYISSKGLYEAHLNGRRIGDLYLTPGWTDYKNRIQYQTYDITPSIKTGANAIAVSVGDGWYRGRIGFRGLRKFYGDARALLVQIEMVYTDGRKQLITTNKNWKCKYGPILSSSIYDGEVFDSRLTEPGWRDAGFFENTTWGSVKVLPKGAEKLVTVSSQGITKNEVFHATKLLVTPKGDTVIDFGQNLAGWVVLRAKGPRGTKIRLRHAEVLEKDGNFYTRNLRSARQENTYILSGDGVEHFEPHFTFQGFRYVCVSGYPRKINLADIYAVALYSDMEKTGSFITSDSLLNKLQHNIQWSQRSNFLDVPTDCPQRDERMGWTADAQVFARTAAFNMDVFAFFTKWMKDLSGTQLKNGAVPLVIPDILVDRQNGDAGWGDAVTIIPWEMYMAYGDQKILSDQFKSMRRWVDYISSETKGCLWNTGAQHGDWLFYSPDDDSFGRAAVTDRYLIAQAFYIHSTSILVRTAKVLGKTNEIRIYQQLLNRIKSAFIAEYLTANGRLASDTQTAYVLALQFDILPENLRQQAAERLVSNIRSYGNHLTTGFLGTPYLCHVLSRFGYTTVAYQLLLQKTYPSWLYPVTQGATSIWERWDGIKTDGSFQKADMNSFNHYAYGAIGDWMYQTIAGISPQADSPGYKVIRICPEPGGGLNSAAAELETAYGKVSSSWKIKGRLFTLQVEIPPNTSASIKLPDGKETGYIGSGNYTFECPIR